MQGRMKTVICYFLSVFCCTACSLDIPYENQFSDPDAITTPHTARDRRRLPLSAAKPRPVWQGNIYNLSLWN